MSERKTQLSVFLEQQVLLAARQRAKEMKLSMSAVVAEAAKESLLSAYRTEREQEILKAVERNFHALRRLDQRLVLEIQILKEMVGLGMRSFFNHTTPIPDATKTAAILSGKQRFHGYLDMLAKNLRKGESILSDLPLPELDPPKEATQPSQNVEEAAPANHAQNAARAKDRATKQTVPTSAPNGARDWALFESIGEK
ncbi:MAG: hypothetical protein ABSB42_03395 [Tepidisphaeraceae bacterium]